MQGSDSGWRDAYQAGRLAWPTVTLTFERFVAHATSVGFPLGSGGSDADRPGGT